MNSQLYSVRSKEFLGKQDMILLLEGDFPRVLPGQFAMLSTGDSWPVFLPRPLSYFDVEPGERGWASFLIKIIGPGTRALGEIPIGGRVQVTGPLGKGFELDEDSRPVCIAGGVGLAPFLLLAKERRLKGLSPIRLLFGGENQSSLVGQGAFPEGAVEWSFSTDDGSDGFKGNVLELYQHLLSQGLLSPSSPVLCCGPDPMMAAVARFCGNQGTACKLSLETMMACGYGVCNGCSVKVCGKGRFEGKTYARACVDGPVFDAEELLWE
jgi:dihydroorotate dehydrogenase electron transfer subunit